MFSTIACGLEWRELTSKGEELAACRRCFVVRIRVFVNEFVDLMFRIRTHWKLPMLGIEVHSDKVNRFNLTVISSSETAVGFEIFVKARKRSDVPLQMTHNFSPPR